MIYKVNVSWSMSGVIEVEADDPDEAFDIANDENSDIPLPDGEYIGGSWQADYMEEI